jgi:hypothetical protein
MANALRDAYSDIFLIKEKPTSSDKLLIEGKFKSFHIVSQTVAGLMTKTFYSLLDLTDINNNFNNNDKFENSDILTDSKTDVINTNEFKVREYSNLGLHYNIQIHLPATKDLEVYNAIFKSLKDHLIE